MASEYSGSPVLHVSITVLDDLDLKNAASVAVPLQQLQDTVMYLNGVITGGIDFDFTDAVFHGTTTFADGSIAASGLTSVVMAASAGMTLGGDTVTVAATDTLALSGDAVAIGSATDVQVNATLLDVRSGQLTVAAGVIQIGTGADVITVTGDNVQLGNTDLYGDVSCSVSLAGGVLFTTTSDVEAAGLLRVTGKLRIRTTNRADGDVAIDGTGGYEHIFPDNPGATRAITLSHTGAALGQRLRFNAQKVVTGTDTYNVAYGARTWGMRNATGSTVILEFVSDGSAWVVDDWAEGGVSLRNG